MVKIIKNKAKKVLHMKWKFDCKKTECIAFLSAMICGSLTHLFALVNVMSNLDDIAQQPYGYGTGISSGRWLLSLLGDFLGKLGWSYNLPFVNGLLFCAC